MQQIFGITENVPTLLFFSTVRLVSLVKIIHMHRLVGAFATDSRPTIDSHVIHDQQGLARR